MRKNVNLIDIVNKNMDGVYWDKNNLTQGMIYSKMLAACNEWGEIQRQSGKEYQERLMLSNIDELNKSHKKEIFKKDIQILENRRELKKIISRIDNLMKSQKNPMLNKELFRRINNILNKKNKI